MFIIVSNSAKPGKGVIAIQIYSFRLYTFHFALKIKRDEAEKGDQYIQKYKISKPAPLIKKLIFNSSYFLGLFCSKIVTVLL